MEETSGQKCCRFLGLQFHYSKLWLFHHNWKAFTYTPWLPYDWRFQIIYLIYRWIITFYFLGWQVAAGVQFSSSRGRYLIFLTSWAFITYNMYLVVAALSSTVSYLSTHFICRRNKEEFSRDDEFVIKKSSGCCGYSDNKLSWYQMVHWLFFTIGNQNAFMVSVLYWALVYRGGPVDGVNANAHLVNGILSIVDLWVSGVPVNLLHVVYYSLYCAIYAVFTGIYYASTNDVIYGILDYGERIGAAIVVIVMTVFLFLPLFHLFFFFMYMAKVWILYSIFGHNREEFQNGGNGVSPTDVGSPTDNKENNVV